jgi:hypothetical protein
MLRRVPELRMVAASVLIAAALPVQSADQVCSATADTMYRACESEVRDDFLVAQAICGNLTEADEREECLDEVTEASAEGAQLCRDQLTARRATCDALGENAYDPQFEPSLFLANFNQPSRVNRYFPLKVGHRWEYQGGSEKVKVQVLNSTKLIEGVRCVVVRDTVTHKGKLMEDTFDWFAQARNGGVWYCGEEVKDYETNAGDRPALPELVSINGSFKVGRDGAKPGIIFPPAPFPGQVYREEFSLGNAEDIAEVLTTSYAYGRAQELDRHVPWNLASRLCAGDCIVTNNYSPIEPGVSERKYYAPGIGLFLTLHPDTGERSQLVNCNVSPRCRRLPKP